MKKKKRKTLIKDIRIREYPKVEIQELVFQNQFLLNDSLHQNLQMTQFNSPPASSVPSPQQLHSPNFIPQKEFNTFY